MCSSDLTSLRKILDLTPTELTDWLIAHDWPKFRAGQLRRWLFRRRATSFEQMTDLPQKLREQLAAEFQLFAATNRRFNQSARQQASLLNVTLIEGADLIDLLSRHPTKRGDLDRFAMAGWSR